MKWIFTLLVVFSFVFGIATNRIDAVNNAILTQSSTAIELSITLAGSICLWSGIMNIAKKSGLTNIIAGFLYPLIGFLFKGLDKKSIAAQLIAMNITANFLGLANASTPIGISAMNELNNSNPYKEKKIASNHMIVLVVINTASIQLIPTTVATLRIKYGSIYPMDIFFLVIILSIICLSVGVLFVKIFNRIRPVNYYD